MNFVNQEHQTLTQLALNRGFPINSIKRSDLSKLCVETGIKKNMTDLPKFLSQPGFKVGFGVYNLAPSDEEIAQAASGVLPIARKSTPLAKKPMIAVPLAPVPPPKATTNAAVLMEEVSYIPFNKADYVVTPFFGRINKIVKSGIFVTVYLSGLSGAGKTVAVQQACAVNKREQVRVNFTEETGERHLIGGFRLGSGNTIWEDGPVLVAMKRGSVLLLDEVDFGSPKMLCLQSILEGLPYINKMTGEVVSPQAGFQIFAAANTKGQVSGRNAKFVGARALNEAFLDRFDINIDVDYMNRKQELDTLTKSWLLMTGHDSIDAQTEQFLCTLVAWSESIRDTFKKGAINDVISTRRLKAAMKSYFIFGKIEIALSDILSRFSDDTKEAFITFYKSLSSIPLGDLNGDESALVDPSV